jgi:hypothetical protein
MGRKNHLSGSDDPLAGCPDDTTNSMTIEELAADRTLVRENFWLSRPEELSQPERIVLSHYLIEYLGIPDGDWYSQREVELMLELHNHLRAWLDEDHALGATLGPSFRRVT